MQPTSRVVWSPIADIGSPKSNHSTSFSSCRPSCSEIGTHTSSHSHAITIRRVLPRTRLVANETDKTDLSIHRDATRRGHMAARGHHPRRFRDMFDTRRQAQSQSTQTKATLLLVSALTVLSSMTLSPTLPGIRAHFHTAPNASILVPLVLTLHAFFIVIGSPLAGYLLDRIGRKPLLIGAALLYGLAGSAGFLINDLWLLLLSRALLGLATAGTFTSASTLIADYYTGQTRSEEPR